jgi:HD superfamily phosphohydrolase
LEQVIFSKMQLYSSVYHHHKVRVAHQAVCRMLAALQEGDAKFGGLQLRNPVTYMMIDDHDIMYFEPSAQPGHAAILRALSLAKSIKDRTLPMKALVLTHPAWGGDPTASSETDRESWGDLVTGPGRVGKIEAEIAERAGVDPSEVWIDVPDPEESRVHKIAQQGFVKFDSNMAMPVQKMFPVGGWLSAYQMYRATSYIFTSADRRIVGEAAKAVLREYDVTVNELAAKLARVSD